MIEKPPKKMGRPATGRDPAYSFRLPSELVESVKKVAATVGRTQSEVVREAIYLGLDVLHGEKPQRGYYLPPGLRPQHVAEVHEAGHAVAVFKVADQLYISPAVALVKVQLKPRGAGVCRHVHFPAKQELLVTVAGAVAQAKHENKSFDEVWKGRGCGGDRRKAKKLGNAHDIYTAIEKVTKWFDDPVTWRGVLRLAENLPNSGHMTGSRCWINYQRDDID
jgi:hypothetical protein